MWRRAPCLEISRCAATSPRDACPRILMKARMVSRLESTQPYYEFFNMLVEIHRRRGGTLPAMRSLPALLIGGALLFGSTSVRAADVTWEHWAHSRRLRRGRAPQRVPRRRRFRRP